MVRDLEIFDMPSLWNRFHTFLCIFITLSSYLTHSYKVKLPNIILKSNSRRYMVQTEPITSMTDDMIYEDVMKAWRKGYASCKEEVCINIKDTNIPHDLIGTYFKNGHAKFNIGNDKVIHPFDGDGMITALSIENGTILFRNKYVRTKGFLLERSSNKISYRNTFGTQKSGGILANIFDLNIKNVANTNVLYHAERLLALWEGGLPHLIETDSLRTQGEYTFHGLLKKGDGFTAHPRVDAKTGNLITFAVKGRGKLSEVEVYKFDQELNLKSTVLFECPGFVFFHDFVVTENYYIFDHAPLGFDPLPFVLGLKCPADCISYDSSKPAYLYLVPRNGDPMQTVQVDPHFSFHFANAYDEDGRINIDVIWADDMVLGKTTGKPEPIWEYVDYQKTVPYYSLMRYTLTPHDDDKSKWTYKRQQLTNSNLDFVSVNPAVSCQKHQYIFGGVSRFETRSSPLCGLSKLDCDTKIEQKWFGLLHEFLQEPVIAPKKKNSLLPVDEDDVYVMALLHNTKDMITDLVVFDGKHIDAGPISRVKLPVYIPFGLHGTFVPDLVCDADEVQRRWLTSDAIE